jgi:hypothetical protein
VLVLLYHSKNAVDCRTVRYPGKKKPGIQAKNVVTLEKLCVAELRLIHVPTARCPGYDSIITVHESKINAGIQQGTVSLLRNATLTVTVRDSGINADRIAL